MSLTLHWLTLNARLYPHPPRLVADLAAAVARFPALRPKTDIYTYDDGRTQLLLCLNGLLPIVFRGATYNIPVALWFPLPYPAEPPIVYVVPTSTMLVRPTPHVDVSGRCTLDYMQDWLRKPEACSLDALLDAMHVHFSRQPPVYSKPLPPARTPPVPPPGRPVLPPKPPPSHTPLPVQTPPHPGPGPPPYASPPQWLQPPAPAPPHTTLPPPAPYPPYLPPQLAPAPPHQQPPAPPPLPPQNLLDGDDTRPIPPSTAPPSAPPRPPNPELLRLHNQLRDKFNTALASLQTTLASDADRQRLTQRDLLAGEPALRDEMGRLEAVRDVCRTVSGRLRGTVEMAERNVADLRRKGDPEVDELVCSTSIVHNQLINLVAEDNAIEDTIYHLHRALNTGRIDLERFLRTTRVLAEEQFTKRALVGKILKGLPIGTSLVHEPRPGVETYSSDLNSRQISNYSW